MARYSNIYVLTYTLRVITETIVAFALSLANVQVGSGEGVCGLFNGTTAVAKAGIPGVTASLTGLLVPL